MNGTFHTRYTLFLVLISTLVGAQTNICVWGSIEDSNYGDYDRYNGEYIKQSTLHNGLSYWKQTPGNEYCNPSYHSAKIYASSYEGNKFWQLSEQLNTEWLPREPGCETANLANPTLCTNNWLAFEDSSTKIGDALPLSVTASSCPTLDCGRIQITGSGSASCNKIFTRDFSQDYMWTSSSSPRYLYFDFYLFKWYCSDLDGHLYCGKDSYIQHQVWSSQSDGWKDANIGEFFNLQVTTGNWAKFTCLDTLAPTKAPTDDPSPAPTTAQTHPTFSPTPLTPDATRSPTHTSTHAPTTPPTNAPSNIPSKAPTISPTIVPTISPTKPPTQNTINSTLYPTKSTKLPTENPSKSRTKSPSKHRSKSIISTVVSQQTDNVFISKPKSKTKENMLMIIVIAIIILIVCLAVLCIIRTVVRYKSAKQLKQMYGINRNENGNILSASMDEDHKVINVDNDIVSHVGTEGIVATSGNIQDLNTNNVNDTHKVIQKKAQLTDGANVQNDNDDKTIININEHDRDTMVNDCLETAGFIA